MQPPPLALPLEEAIDELPFRRNLCRPKLPVMLEKRSEHDRFDGDLQVRRQIVEAMELQVREGRDVVEIPGGLGHGFIQRESQQSCPRSKQWKAICNFDVRQYEYA